MSLLITALLLAPALVLIVYYARRTLRTEQASLAALNENFEAGLIEPASLHPVIDSAQCIGCGACVEACPEQQVLGMIDGRAELVGPSHCIGHGACKSACPTDAIALVFGTATRGVEIPMVAPNFESNVPGLFIAGELGGMGLIRNAIEQGRQALEAIRKVDGVGRGDGLDVLIVGAGPAGFAASLAAMQHGISFVAVEQDSLGGTVFSFPRGKIVMTAPVDLPLIGKVRFKETTKEQLLEFWQDVERKTGVPIRYGERVESIERRDGRFLVRTTRTSYAPRTVLLAIGRRGTPRKLGVPGEELQKVTYRLIDPEQYRGRHVLVVGGGDSALEAAASLAEQPGAHVSLSHRSPAFNRAKRRNRERIETLATEGRLNLLLKSNVRSIEPRRVQVEHDGRLLQVRNDDVIVCAGGILPTTFLEQVGIAVETRYGTH